MSEYNNEMKYSIIENSLKTILSEDMMENTLDFLDFLKTNNFLLNSNNEQCLREGQFIYLDEEVCYFNFDEHNLRIFGADCNIYDYENEDLYADEQFIELIRSSVQYCGYFDPNRNCNCGEPKENRRMIFDKEYINLCKCPICFHNPATESFRHIKKLVEIRKHNIDDKRCY